MTDLRQFIVFSAIESQQAAKNSLELFLDIAGGSKGKQLSKQKADQFLTMMQTHLQSKDASPKSKFYSLYMIKLIIEQSISKIISLLTVHSLLKYMHQIAKQTDPNKPITEKGKSLFPDKQLGNDYVRLVLECMKVLSERSRGKGQEPTKFRKLYAELEDMKIVLPKELKFFDEGRSKKTLSANEVASVQKSRESIQNSNQVTKKGEFKYSKYLPNFIEQDIDHSLSKISLLIDTLKTEQDPQTLRQQCENSHRLFLKDGERYKKIINTLDYEGDNGAHQILALNDFYMHEDQLYRKYLANQKDYYSYSPEVLMAAQSMYQMLGINVPQSEQKIQERLFKKSQQPTNISRKNHLVKDSSESNKELVAKLMSHLDERSKSPNVGFKAIKQSLSKDKSFGKSKRSTSGFRKSNVTKFGKSMSKSKISQAFAAPPNPYPRDKKYDGQLIEPNKDLQKVMKQLSKKQGIRRFITCNFKEKNPLFENTHVQIGIKSQPVYENVNDFKVLIGIEMYIGNKSEQLVKNMSISYKGNQDVLLYGNPRTVDSVLMGRYQQKHELLIVPLNYTFPLIKMYLKYSVNDETFYENIALPNSILKLAHHGLLQKKQFIQNWNSSTIYRTSEFKWTRQITPDSLSKYIKTLLDLTPYEKFIIPGSQSDYELGCQVILKQRYEGVVRICIRPNFNAVIQVGVLENNQQAIQSFIFYAQTLQALLTHIENKEL